MIIADTLHTGKGVVMITRSVRRKLGSLLFTLGGLGFFLAGALHPHGDGSSDYDTAIATMLRAPVWVATHEIAMVTGLVLATAFWLLMDVDFGRESLWSDLGARLGLVATLFMTVEFAVEAAAKTSPGLLALVNQMQAIGWPAFGLGLALVAAGARNAAPLAVRCIGAAGAAAMGLAGLLVEGLHFLYLGPLFMGGSLLAFWMVWAGIRTAVSDSTRSIEATEQLGGQQYA
jgi:hypothetical protein